MNDGRDRDTSGGTSGGISGGMHARTNGVQQMNMFDLPSQPVVDSEVGGNR